MSSGVKLRHFYGLFACNVTKTTLNWFIVVTSCKMIELWKLLNTLYITRLLRWGWVAYKSEAYKRRVHWILSHLFGCFNYTSKYWTLVKGDLICRKSVEMLISYCQRNTIPVTMYCVGMISWVGLFWLDFGALVY